MKRVELKDSQFIVLTLNKEGAISFRFLKDGLAGKREVYFINSIRIGGITKGTMLLGQFIFEFENLPNVAIPMAPGGTNRIYFPTDKRIAAYDMLTEEEKKETKNRLTALAKKHAEYAHRIRILLQKI